MRDFLTNIVLQQKAQQRAATPIKYWEAWSKNNLGAPYQLIDEDNSIAILRNKYGSNFIYKPIR